MQKARRLPWDQVKYAFFSGGPLTFKVEWIAEHELPFKNPTTLVFKWDGSWETHAHTLPQKPRQRQTAATLPVPRL